MSAQTPIRLAALFCLAIPACAQYPQPSQFPATPTTVPAAQPQPAVPNRPQVTYTGDKLTVKADNSSLNQILHEISRVTGITITGGVTDERVFGGYGPGSISEVLNQLLDGTSSNMLFLSSTGGKPAELILTPRAGGPTPPNPNAMRFEDNNADDTDAQAAQPVNPPEPPDESNPPQPARSAAPVAPANQAAPATPTNTTGTAGLNGSEAPTDARTPQQIFDQLMKLRQQQQQQQQQSH